MMFRTPTDDTATNESFYESEYAQGFRTDVPWDADLVRLTQANFAGTEKDYRPLDRRSWSNKGVGA
jgi:hypothetical protein